MADGTGSTKERQFRSSADVREATRPPDVGVGETVVYAAHGVGTVVARGRNIVAGTERECVVVEFEAGLRVTLSLDEAACRLRPVADRAELDLVGSTLAAQCGAHERSWTKRIKDSKAKLARGNPGDLAEIVRDGAGRERPGAADRLSDGERRVYLRARELLVREISTARRVDVDEADGWIDTQIASFDESED